MPGHKPWLDPMLSQSNPSRAAIRNQATVEIASHSYRVIRHRLDFLSRLILCPKKERLPTIILIGKWETLLIWVNGSAASTCLTNFQLFTYNIPNVNV